MRVAAVYALAKLAAPATSYEAKYKLLLTSARAKGDISAKLVTAQEAATKHQEEFNGCKKALAAALAELSEHERELSDVRSHLKGYEAREGELLLKHAEAQKQMAAEIDRLALLVREAQFAPRPQPKRHRACHHAPSVRQGT